MPMKNSCTPVISPEDAHVVVCEKEKSHKAPSERTLQLLKLFARNYQVEKMMPQGLREIILS